MTVVSIPHTAFELAIAASAWAAVGMPPGWRGSALTGALLGLAQYLRPTAPALLPAFIIARLWPGGGRGRVVAAVLVPVAAFLLVLMPVVLYNLAAHRHAEHLDLRLGGHTLFIGTDEASGGQFSEEANEELIRLAGPDLLARSELGTEIALQRIRDDPLGIAALAVRKQDTLWGTEHFGVQYGIRQSLADRPQHPDATTPLLLSQGFYTIVLLTSSAGRLAPSPPTGRPRAARDRARLDRVGDPRPARGARPPSRLRDPAAVALWRPVALVSLADEMARRRRRSG